MTTPLAFAAGGPPPFESIGALKRCVSTLMEFYNDRRDIRPAGQRRRELFGALLDMLEKKGLPEDTARTELLKMMYGRHSPVLEKMGIRFRIT